MADEETEETEETTAAGAPAPEAPEPEAAEAAAVDAAAGSPEAEAAEAPAADAAPEAGEEPEADATPAAEAEPEPAPEAEAAPAAAAAPAPEPEAPETVERTKRKRLPRSLRHKHSKPARTPAKERRPITRTPREESVPGRRQERRGVVVSDKGDKTIVVEVQTVRIHSKYKKVVRRSNKLHAHDEQNSAGVGDIVRVVETRPLSKTKRWRLAEIVEKAR